MKRKEPKIANWISQNIMAIITLFFQVLQTIITACGGEEISWKFFCITIFVSVIFCIYKIIILFIVIIKECKKYMDKRRQLEDSAIKYGHMWKVPYSKRKAKIKETFVANCMAICVKRCGLPLAFLTVIILTCVCNPQNANAYWNDIKIVMGFTPEEDSAAVEENITDSEKETENIKETEQEVRNTKWRFILSEPTYSFDLELQMKKQVFFESDKSFTEWVDDVQATVEQWKGEREGVDYKTVKDQEGNGYFTYTDLEDTFKSKVADASQYIYYEEWRQNAPDSSEYDECIAGRRKLSEVEAGGKTGCYDIWWKLANDYQYFAQEYETQTTNADAVMYYYTNSIYCCMEALKYSITEEEYNTTYHFMVMRYHDICRDECIIPQEYKVAASNIYSILAETDAKN